MSTPRSTRLPRGVERVTADTGRGAFAALVAGPAPAGRRGAALLVPGFTGSKEDFTPLLPLLADAGYAVAAYDQRGQFETESSPGDDLSLAGLAADALAVAGALLGDEAPHLVGHSFGGLVAATAAVEHTAAWRSLLMLCSGPMAVGADRDDLRVLADRVESVGLEEVYAAYAVADEVAGVAPQPPEIEAFLRERFLRNSAAALAAFARHLMDAPDLTPRLAALDLPIAVVRGADDDAWPHSVQDAFAAAVGTRTVVIEGAAHSPNVEQPEATCAAMLAGWER